MERVRSRARGAATWGASMSARWRARGFFGTARAGANERARDARAGVRARRVWTDDLNHALALDAGRFRARRQDGLLRSSALDHAGQEQVQLAEVPIRRALYEPRCDLPSRLRHARG